MFFLSYLFSDFNKKRKMADLKLPDIVELLRKALNIEQNSRVIILAKNDDQADTALKTGTITLVPQVRVVGCPNCIIYLSNPEAENV